VGPLSPTPVASLRVPLHRYPHALAQIFVLDTGIVSNHAEFGGVAGPNRAGFGADCTSGACLTTVADPGDCHGHGTNVAGAAVGR
jgi:hypothetical protein